VVRNSHAIAGAALLFALVVAAVPNAAPETVLAGAVSAFPSYAGVFHSSTASANPIAEFPIPNSSKSFGEITSGPDGNLWFTGRGDSIAGGIGVSNKIGRITPAGVITQFSTPTADSAPSGITRGPDGNLWFTELSANKVGRMTTVGVITEFALTAPFLSPDRIVAGSDGNLWFTDGAGNIGRITTAGVVTQFTANAAGIAAGSDANLWFTGGSGNKIGRITTAGVITEFSIPTANSGPSGIVAGPDANLWFTEIAARKIGRITTAGVITEFALPFNSASGSIASGSDGNLWFTADNAIGRITTAGAVTQFSVPGRGTFRFPDPNDIASGPDGSLWFTEYQRIGRMTTGGLLTEFAVPGVPFAITAGPDGNLWFTQGSEIGQISPAGAITEFPVPGQPMGITAGPDGNLWFTEVFAGSSPSTARGLGRITTAGVITEYAVPNGDPTGITSGPDGNLWFTESFGNKVGRITPVGAITEYSVPTANSSPRGITSGPDGNLWFIESQSGKVARITTAGVITEFPGVSGLNGIAAGPDGNLWITEGDSTIVRMTTAGAITRFTVPNVFSRPSFITAGPSGDLWFTEQTGYIGQITTAGAITEFPITTASSTFGIVTGPDRNLWFTELSANQIGRLTPGLGLPSHVQVVAGDGEATLTWTPPPNTGPAITGYTVVASPGGATVTVSSVVPAATVTGLTNGTAYTFTVAAINSVGTGPASAATSAVTPATVAKGPSVAVLPAMSNGAYGGYLTTAYLQNVSGSAAHIRVQYFDKSGLGVGSGNSVNGLPAGATWTLRTDNGNSIASLQAGSAVIYSDQSLAVFVNEFAPGNSSDATSYSAINLVTGTGSTIYAPTIVNNAYGGYTTGVGLVNLATSSTNITATYRDNTGAMIKTQTLSVAAGAYQDLYSGDATLALPNNFAGTATITSSAGNLAAVVNETGPGNQFSSYDAVPAGSTTLYAPVALRNAYGGYNTGMGIQNTTGSAGTVNITYYDSVGAATVKSFSIAANGYVGVYQGTDIPTAGAYTAKLSSSVAIAAIVNEVAPSSNPSIQQSTSYNTFAAGSSSLHLPLVESAGADGWSTGLGIMNTGSASTAVTVTYYDAATGLTIGTPQTLTLAPNAFWGLYQPAGGLPNGMRASAVVTTGTGGQVVVICNETSATTFMSYNGQ
jgi:streptogramin lyase